MTKKQDLEIGFEEPACSTFEMTGEHFPWFRTNVVILCFDSFQKKSCYSFDGKLNYIGNSNFKHYRGGLTKYNGNPLTVGGLSDNQKTEILKLDENKNFTWSVVETEFKFVPGEFIFGHSLVTVESSDINEDYVLLIGGYSDQAIFLKNVFKFNGTWFPFGQLNRPGYFHNSIYWNGAVFVIGGANNDDDNEYKKMEIWNIKESPDQFKTKETWPELDYWDFPHIFIVPDSFFPDY